MEPNEKVSFWTKTKNTFKKNNYFWTKIASAILAGIIVIILIICLATCNGHNHKYDSAWSSDETNHWHQATCEHDKKKDLAAHTYGDWVIVTEATETTKGSKKRVCSVCDYVDTAEIAVIPHTHSLVHHEAVAAGDEDGNIEYWSCSGCGKYFSDANATVEITDKTSVVISAYSKGLEYTLNLDGTTYSVGIGTCTDTDIVIPSTHEGKNVTNIADNAFEFNTSIKSIVMPNTITTIDWYAFNGCTNLTTIVIPESVKTIDGAVFYGCENLQSIYYKGNLSAWNIIDISDSYNDELNNATKYYYSETLPSDSANYWHYDTNGSIKVWYSEGLQFELSGNTYNVVGIGTCSDTNLIIPSIYNGLKVESINSGAFKNNSNITSVVICEGVVNIYSHAFSDCNNLQSVVIANSVKNIDGYAFQNCYKLSNANLGTGVQNIGQYAFAYTKIETIIIPISVTNIGIDSFSSCFSLKAINYVGTEEKWNQINGANSGYSGTINFGYTS